MYREWDTFFHSPYSSADLRLMASSFNTSVAALEDELMTLILDGKIQARIDSHNKVISFLKKQLLKKHAEVEESWRFLKSFSALADTDLQENFTNR